METEGDTTEIASNASTPCKNDVPDTYTSSATDRLEFAVILPAKKLPPNTIKLSPTYVLYVSSVSPCIVKSPSADMSPDVETPRWDISDPKAPPVPKYLVNPCSPDEFH